MAPTVSAAVPDPLELLYQLQPKAAKWYVMIDTSLFPQQQSAGHGLPSPGGMCRTPGIDCPRGGSGTTVQPSVMD